MPEQPKFDDFTAKVVTDPAKPQGTVLIQGFLGASSEADHTRVYADISLESYVDVANADIVHVEALPKDQSPLGGSYLWVKKEADVSPGSGEPNAAKAKFLEGPIAAEAAVSAPVQPAAPLPKTIPIVVCHPTLVLTACPTTIPVRCPTRIGPYCPPGRTERLCPSLDVVCPTLPEYCLQAEPAAGQAQALAAQPAAAAQPNLPSLVCHQTVVCPSVLCPTFSAACYPTHYVFCRPTLECPVQSVICTIPVQSIACGLPVQGTQQQFEAQAVQQPQPQAAPALPASQILQQCPSGRTSDLSQHCGGYMPDQCGCAVPDSRSPLPVGESI